MKIDCKLCVELFSIIEKQRKEFEEAQIKDRISKLEIEEQKKKQKEEEERIIKENALKKKAEEEEMKNRRESLPVEPDIENPNACELAFRLPSGKRVSRRFLKTNTIQTLYNYISVLNEKDLKDETYEISQAVPKKSYINIKATLEEEGLTSKVALQVCLLESDE